MSILILITHIIYILYKCLYDEQFFFKKYDKFELNLMKSRGYMAYWTGIKQN
jgi:hypothetical protein